MPRSRPRAHAVPPRRRWARADEVADHPRIQVVAPADELRAPRGVVIVGERLTEDVDVDGRLVTDDMQGDAAPRWECLWTRPAAVDRRERTRREIEREDAAVLDVEPVHERAELGVDTH